MSYEDPPSVLDGILRSQHEQEDSEFEEWIEWVECPLCKGTDDRCPLCWGAGECSRAEAEEWHREQQSVLGEDC